MAFQLFSYVLGLGVAALIFASTYLFQDMLKGATTRAVKRRDLRIQRFLFRGRYPLGAGISSESAAIGVGVLWFIRGAMLVTAVFMIVLLVRQLFQWIQSAV